MNNFSTQGVDIVRIMDEEDFYCLENSWNRLLKNSSNNNPFLTWDWLYTWWSFYKKGKELCILLIKEKGEILGIAPLYLCVKRIMGVPINFLRIMGDEEVCSEYLDIIVKENKEEEIYPFLCHYLTKSGLSWDVLFFSDVLKDSKFLPFIVDFPSDRGMKAIIRDVTINPYLILPATWAQYLEFCSKNVKKNFKRRCNKLSKSFKWRFGPCPDDCNKTLEQAMVQMMYLHEKRWEQKKQYGVFRRKKFRRFHLNVAELFYNKGWLRIFFIWINQRAVAALYGYQYGQKFYFYQMGVNPQMAKFGIGNLLLLLSIQHSVDANLKEYDFLRGESPYKYQLTKNQRKNISIHVARNTFKGMLAHFYHYSRPILKTWIKSKMPDKIWKYLSDTKYRRIMKD